MDTTNEILTVLVLYEMNLENSPAYQTLSQGLEETQKKGRLCVYDNSPIAQTIPISNVWTIEYIHDTCNPGVSCAYNRAASRAKQLNLKWLLLADQDTTFVENIYKCYSESINKYPHCHLFAPKLIDEKGLISPFKRGITSGKRLKNITSGRKNLEEIQVINSGLLIDVETFEAVGGYNEKLKLDFSDFYFFKRLKQYTSEIIIIDAECNHKHSSSESVNLLKAVNRFKIYLQASTIMGNDHMPFLFYYRSFLRSIKLSLQYNSLRFIGLFFNRRS